MRKCLALLTVMLGFGVLAGTAAADPGGTNLPLRVSGSGTVNEDFFSGSLSGGSLALHLGKGSFSGSSFVDGFPNGCPDTGTGAQVSIQLVAANGDTLNMNVDQTVCEVGSALDFDATGTYTITGGTGRFSNATGSGTLSSTYHFPFLPIPGTGDYTFQANGTISLNN